jgi:hypothetical protein
VTILKKEVNMRGLFYLTIAALLIISNFSPAIAQSSAEKVEKQLEILQNQMEKLKRELKEMKEKEAKEKDVTEELDELKDEVASLKEEGLSKKVSLGGYGELHYNSFQSSSKSDELDFHRFVLFFGYEFNDWIRFESELELEHVLAGEGKEGEVELEQAFIDFQTSQFLKVPVNFRAGIMLVPVGIINQYHEPPVFYGVERPDVDKNIIPTTWWEGGAGIYGDIISGLKYKLNLVSSLDASGFSASSGIRGGRQKVSEAKFEDFALTGRLEFTGLPGLKVGTSFFWGDTGQDDPDLGDATTTLWETDVQYSIWNFDFRGLYALIDVDDADKISRVTGQTIGEKLYGGYVEGAFRFLSLIFPDTEQEMAVFARFEKYNTQDEVPSGFSADPANDVEVIQVGLDYKPHPNVVVKMDYQDRDNSSLTKEAADQFNIGIGYMF